jgi:hypothetical protein
MVFLGLGIYFAVGVLALGLLDLLTKRIRRRILDASLEAQAQLLVSGSSVGYKEAVVLTVAALWLFWPTAIYAALTDRKGGDDG